MEQAEEEEPTPREAEARESTGAEAPSFAKAAEAEDARRRSWWETARRKLVPEREAA